MSTAVEIMQAGMNCWFTGGLNGPDKDTNYDKYFSENIVWEYNLGLTAPALAPYDGTFSGKEGFWHVMKVFDLLELKEPQAHFLAGPSDDKSLCILEFFCGVRGTEKVSEKRMSSIVQWTLKDGKVVHIKTFGSDPQIYNALFA